MAIKRTNSLASVGEFECYGRPLPGIRVRVVGLTPMLMNNASSMNVKVGSKATPEEQAAPLVIDDGKGYLAIPSFALRTSLCDGGAFIPSPIPKKKMKSFLYETISILPEEWLTLTRDGVPIPDTEWDIDGRRVRMKGTGGSVWRHRPKIELPWAFEAVIVWDTPFTTQGDQEVMLAGIRESAHRSGVCVGLGDFRPQTKGIFGRYELTIL